jgi:hypothetical protein
VPPPVATPEASPIALGIDAGHVRSVRRYRVRSFEVIVAQVSGTEGKGPWCIDRGPWLRERLGREYGQLPPVFWMIDALQGQRGAPPQDTPGALQGEQLAGV